MKCFQCNKECSSNSTFCLKCKNSLLSTCSNCEIKLPITAKFCLECGWAVHTHQTIPSILPSPLSYTPQHLTDKILQSQSAIIGERKHVTVLFCDLVKSTVLAKKLGQESMHTLLNKFFELAVSEVHRYEGTLNQFLGDGFMALFGAPLACEDHSHRAALTALGIQHAIMKRGMCNEYANGQQVSIRIGLNSGPVIVGTIGHDLRMDYTAIGDTTNMAARLETLAEPGTIYLSEKTYQKIERQFECKSHRTQLPKSEGETLTVYELQGIRSKNDSKEQWAINNIRSPLIGRDSELETLITQLEQNSDKTGKIAFIVGEPGIGKSRLVAEARQDLSAKGISCLEGRAFSHSQTTSYGLFVDLIKSDAGIRENDGDPEIWEKLKQRVAALFPDEWTDLLPYLATLLSLTLTEKFENQIKYLNNEDMGHQIFRTSRHYFDRLAQDQQLVLFFEDLHWSDESSMKLLEHLLPLIKTVPLFICCMSRPELNQASHKLRTLLNENYASDYTEITLGPLSKSESVNVVSNLLGNDILLSCVQEVTIRKAGGNPFFLEEIVRSLIDTGTLDRVRNIENGQPAKRINELDLPESIDEVIMTRVDRLPENLKYVLKLASVIGRSFLYKVLDRLVRSEEELTQSLTILKDRGFIKEKKAIPELEYFFQHALVQEAVYDSILLNRRLELHRQVAECIESLFVDRKDEFNSLLAYHYARAQKEQSALHYLLKAGDQAGQLAADAEALAHYNQAMETAIRVFGNSWDPLQRASLERKIGEALFRLGKNDEAIFHLHQALNFLGHPYPRSPLALFVATLRQLLVQIRCRIMLNRVGNPPEINTGIPHERSQIYESILWIDVFIKPKTFLYHSLLLLNTAEKHGLLSGMVVGSSALGVTCNFIPAFRLANYYHRKSVKIAEQIGHPIALGQAYVGFAYLKINLAQWEHALTYISRAREAYWKVRDLRGWGLAMFLLSLLQTFRGRFETSLNLGKEMVRVGQAGNDSQLRCWGLISQAQNLRRTGFVDDALKCLQDSISLSEAVPDYTALVFGTSEIAQCLVQKGNHDEALFTLKEKDLLICQQGLRGLEVAFHAIAKGEAMLAHVDQASGVERSTKLASSEQACRIARKQCQISRVHTIRLSRLEGVNYWLQGEHAAAKKNWEDGIALSQKAEIPYDLGLFYLEMGKRMNSNWHLKQGEEMLRSLGVRNC